LSINGHGSRRGDTQVNAITLNGGHDDPDVLVNHDCFTDTPSEDQHCFLSLIVENASFQVGIRAQCPADTSSMLRSVPG
jgi:hypothetical protein